MKLKTPNVGSVVLYACLLDLVIKNDNDNILALTIVWDPAGWNYFSDRLLPDDINRIIL